MGAVADAFAEAFRDFVAAGIPASGAYEPEKALIRAIGPLIETVAASAGAGLERYATVSAMEAVTDSDDGQLAYVYDNNGDPGDPANGIYQWDDGGNEWVAADWYFGAVAAVVQPLVDDAEDAAELAQKWAESEGEEPGGAGTKSSKEWADVSEGHAAVAGSTATIIGKTIAPPGTVTVGSTAPDSSSAQFTNFRVATATLPAGVEITGISIRMSNTATLQVYLVSLATLKVVKKWTGFAVTAGVNALNATSFAGYITPEPCYLAFRPSSGGGQIRYAATDDSAIMLRTSAAHSDLAEGDTFPTVITENAGSAIAVAISYRGGDGLTQARQQAERQKLNAALAENVASRPATFTVGQTEPYTGTLTNPTAGNAYLTAATDRPGMLTSITITLQSWSMGMFFVLSPSGKPDVLATAHFFPSGVLLAGQTTIAVPETYLPAGSRIGYKALAGALPAFIGTAATNGQYVVANTITGAIGQEVTLASVTHALIGATLRGPSRRLTVPASVETSRDVSRRTRRVKLPQTFQIGVWMQPPSLMATWKARGVDFVHSAQADYVSGPGSGPAWLAGLASNSLNYVRRPGLRNGTPEEKAAAVIADCKADAVERRCIGFNMIDEPSLYGHDEQAGYPTGVTNNQKLDTWAYCEREAAIWAQWAPHKARWVTQLGNNLLVGGQPGDEIIRRLLDMDSVDVHFADRYPNATPAGAVPIWTGVYPALPTQPEAYTTVQGAMMEYLRQDTYAGFKTFGSTLSAGKPVGGFLATSKIRTEGRDPTPGEFRAQAWSLVIGGAIAFTYFPQIITPAFQYDGTPPDIVTEMATLRSNIDVMQATGALVDPLYGGRVPFRKYLSQAARGAVPTTDVQDPPGAPNVQQNQQLPLGFEACEVVVGNKLYRLIQNFTSASRDLTYAPWGYSSWSFSAFETKFVEATGAPTTNLFSSSGL